MGGIVLEGRGFALPTLVIQPGRELIMFRLEIEKDRLGLISEISNEFASRGMNIFYMIAQTSPEGKGSVFVVSEGRESDVLEDLRRSLESLEGVGRVVLETSGVRGLLISHSFFPLTRAGRRVVLMIDRMLESLVEELVRMIGEDPANAVIFRVGYEFGRGAGKLHLTIGEEVGLKDPLDVIKHISAPLFVSSGYGIMHVEELPQRVLRIVVKENVEASLRGSSRRPACFLIKGICKGALEEIFGKHVSIDEVKCKAAGHEFCEFIASY